MNDEQKPEDNKDTVEQPAQVAPAPPAPDAASIAEQPAAQGTPASTPRTRRILLTSGAGLALAGGVIGFGIGHATADGGDGDRFRPTSQTVPGEGQPGMRDGERPNGPPNGFGNRDQSGNQQSNGDNDPT